MYNRVNIYKERLNTAKFKMRKGLGFQLFNKIIKKDIKYQHYFLLQYDRLLKELFHYFNNIMKQKHKLSSKIMYSDYQQQQEITTIISKFHFFGSQSIRSIRMLRQNQENYQRNFRYINNFTVDMEQTIYLLKQIDYNK
ncbi:hypothetical protein pb186bvf_020528 [Paramecium bursaria]